jgi:hypothetical protein
LVVSTTAPASIEDLIADAVAVAGDGSDAAELARSILADLAEDEVRSLAIQTLERSIRKKLLPSSPRATGGGQIAPAVPRSARWDTVTRAAESGELDLARMQVETGAESKPLLDCLYLDLLNASDNHIAFALANERFADQYRKLAEVLLEDDDARTVRDLPEETVRRILSA